MPDLPLARPERMPIAAARLRAPPDFMFTLEEFGAERARGIVHCSDRTVPIDIRYHLDFPFTRPTIHTEDERVRSYRHVNRAGEVCTLRLVPDDWEPDELTAADLVVRAWKLIANEGWLEPEEDDQQPIALDFKIENGPMLLVPECALPGNHVYGVALIQPSVQERGLALTALLDDGDERIWDQSSDERLNGRYALTGKAKRVPWFTATATPPSDVGSLTELEGIMPAGFLSRLAGLARGLRKEESRQHHILVHFEDETGPRWVFLGVKVTRTRSQGAISSVCYLPCYSVGPDSFFGRIEGLLDREKLSASRVLVIGQGAVGSNITQHLTQCGVGEVVGFDGGIVEPGNPVRGQLPFRDIGLAKVHSLRRSAEEHLPYSRYTPVPAATSSEQGRQRLEEFLAEGVDLVVVAVGHHNSSRAIDLLLARYSVPRVHTWTSRGAAAGVVFSVLPVGDSPDYSTYDRLVQAGALPALPEDAESEVPNVTEGGCAAPVLPGTPIDIGTVALHAARTAVEILQHREVEPYQVWTRDSCSWESFALDDEVQLQTESSTPAVDVRQVNLSYDARLAIEEEIRSSPKSETGGVLLGNLAGESLVITCATGPGPGARRSRDRLVLDNRYCQGAIDAARNLSRGQLRYYGEWHSHPAGDLSPSPDDLRSLETLATSSTSGIAFPVIIIACLDQRGDLSAKAFTYRTGETREIELIAKDLQPGVLDR
jgi:integrative and conjugative element protein (TIGR02256 family)